jgi:hypothetical protein
MKRKTRFSKSRKNKQRRQRTRRFRKTQRGGNMMSSMNIPEGAVMANPIEIDGGYKFETP